MHSRRLPRQVPVAVLTDAVIVRSRFRAARDIVRVVTSRAAQFALALQEALRFAQPVSGVSNLEPVAGLSSRAIELRDRMRQAQAGSLQVALHAHLHLPLCRKPLRIHDRRSNLLRRRSPFRRQFDVPLPRPMTSLTIDAFRERLEESHLRARRMFQRFGDLRISVVTEDAFVMHRADGAGIIGLIVARTHLPIASLFRIPAQRKNLKRAARREMKISPRMIARAYNKIDRFFVDIRLFSIETNLPAPLIIFAPARDRGEIAVRSLVMESLAWRNRRLRPHPRKRPSHAGFAETGRFLAVAVRADGRINVGIGDGRVGGISGRTRQSSCVWRSQVKPGARQNACYKRPEDRQAKLRNNSQRSTPAAYRGTNPSRK